MDEDPPKRFSFKTSPSPSHVYHSDEKYRHPGEKRQREGRGASAKKTSCHRPLTPFGTKAKGGLVSEFGITERGSNEFDLKSSFGIVKTKEYVPPYPENEIHGLFLHMETANKRFDKLKKSREGAQASLFDGLVL
eukprot:CAMPEP_0167791470 /NCGR_PEP_ID=MMETSP0111_2-20121227/11961_1 /TAXON_ID=91324 /ORGANISM="Lotharella globosa, Strain CCCM811" /LENGTH=134 /DNA_ID=CAMNT_0007684157 /DNA_START=221 /DNA_END=625 /DNA_ORIENTATION=-